jgi:membrane protein involved in colicin uptake
MYSSSSIAPYSNAGNYGSVDKKITADKKAKQDAKNKAKEDAENKANDEKARVEEIKKKEANDKLFEGAIDVSDIMDISIPSSPPARTIVTTPQRGGRNLVGVSKKSNKKRLMNLFKKKKKIYADHDQIGSSSGGD